MLTYRMRTYHRGSAAQWEAAVTATDMTNSELSSQQSAVNNR
jgi:hypothetical protein